MAEIVFIGDDFTGASDTLATLAENGLRVRLFLEAPDDAETTGLDAVGLATDLRARTREEIVTRLDALAPAIRRLSPRYVHYKVCSTFDSAPNVGSIGVAVKALEAALKPLRTIILGGQPSLGRYCVFGTLFARAPDNQIYRIDRHPIMSRHPVTPMEEADLRLHLGRQGLERLSLVSRSALRNLADAEPAMPVRALFDALEQSDVNLIGEALHAIGDDSAPLLIIGATSVAEALLHAKRMKKSSRRETHFSAGPMLAVAGSRSSATAAQVGAATSFERIPLGRDDLGKQARIATQSAQLLKQGRNVFIYLQPDIDYGHPSTALSDWLAELTKSILHQEPAAGLAVAGGDTSSAIVKRLGFRSLSFVERMGAGVAVCRGHADGSPIDGAVLLLKGGQVGDVDLFERFAARIAW